MPSSFWERMAVSVLGGAYTRQDSPLTELSVMLFSIMGYLVVMGIFVLIGRYFFRWGHEQIHIIRGRDSLGSFKRKRPSVSRSSKPVKRRRRRLLDGIRNRRDQ